MHAEVSEDLTPSQVRPPLNPNLVKVQKKIEKQAPNEVNIVSISLDPDHDAPAALKA